MAAAAGVIVRGSKGRVDFGNSFYGNFEKYRLTFKVQKLDGTTYESTTDSNTGTNTGIVFEDGDATLISCDGEVSGYYDNGNNPFASPPKLGPGCILTSVQIWINKATGGNVFGFARIQIMSCTVNSDVKGRTDFSFNFESRGTITYPTA